MRRALVSSKCEGLFRENQRCQFNNFVTISTEGKALFYVNFMEQPGFSLVLIAGIQFSVNSWEARQISLEKECRRMRLNEVAFFHVSFDFITSRRQSFYLTVIL